MKLRAEINEARTLWQNLLSEIQTDAAWTWANNDANKGAMQKDMDTFNNVITPFGGQWLSTEPAKMKKVFCGCARIVAQ